MLKKIKRYLLLIPLLFVMLLNVSVYGHVVATDSDYSRFFLDPPEDVIEYLDFTDVEQFDLFDFPDFSNYYYQVQCSLNEYEFYISGKVDYLDIHFLVCDFSNSVNFIRGDFLTATTNIKYYNYWYTFYRDSGYSLVSSDIDFRYFYFTPQTGAWGLSSSSFSSSSDEVRIPDYHTLYIECDYFDLNSSSSSSLNVDVVFSPELTGAFSRTVMQNGQKVTLDTLNFTVTNNSNFPIQYIFAIVNRDEDFFVYNDSNSYSVPNGKVFGGNPSYVYVKDEWLYLPSGETKKNVTSTFAPSSWHYVSSKNSDSVNIGFNQMKLNIGVYYNVYVYAIRNDSSQVLCIPYNIDSWQYNEDYVIDFSFAELVYSSVFTISNPATFDPTANDGSYAFDIDDRQLFNRANGYIDDNGNVVIDRIDTDSLIGSSDSWGSQFDSNAWDTYYKNQNTVSSDIDQLSRNFSSFFRFVNKVFSYFPKNYQSIIILGLTSLVVLGLFKVLI